MEVEAAEMAGDVHDFSDEIEARDSAGFHGFRGKLVRIHAAGCDFGFVVPFRTLWDHGPVVGLALHFGKSMVRP